jgi:hypothetical protein
MVMVGGTDVMGQCLAMGGCQTLKLLIIITLILNFNMLIELKI